ncbi:MAG TPA: prolyl oligopeptidase family serine peptidase [Ktedonobacteraceae bacterium]|nr:prolyl oligopeptidase family serine peptidase [Ktedonobacteraceae bacterium]
MKRRLLFLFALLILLSGLLVSFNDVHAATNVTQISGKCVNPNGTTVLHGQLQGAYYTISVPSNWNGTLALYSHGYVFAGQPLPNPAPDAGDPLTEAALLQDGYALAGSSYSQNGWALQQAFHDQITLLDYFNATCGHPTRTIAWGHSLGGIITAGLVQLYPDRFVAALPMCGVVAGGIGTWNQALDSAFAFDDLLAGNALPIVHITDPTGTYNQAESILATAQNTAQGQARIALAAALADIPGWFDPSLPEPGSKDYIAQEQNQYLWESQVDFAFAFIARAELEGRAGGNPSWNTGVDYRTQLANSSDSREVKALYKKAGLNLKQDLNTLNATQRIQADPGAVDYLNKYITFNGDLNMPVLTMHTTGDGLVVNQDEQAYKSVVAWRGDSNLLRQVFVHRAGHCAFTPAETVTAFQTLIQRVDTGTWGDSTDPGLMNKEALALGPGLNTAPPAFINFKPTVFLRPFDVRNRR